ncbi:hypothetical protein D3C86_1607380 [compost metagenome]
MNGTTNGNVEPTTNRKTPRAPLKSFQPRPALIGKGGCSINRRRNNSRPSLPAAVANCNGNTCATSA